MQKKKVVSMLGKDCFIIFPAAENDTRHGNYYIGQINRHDEEFWLTVQGYNDGNPFKVNTDDIAAMLPMQSLLMFTGRKLENETD